MNRVEQANMKLLKESLDRADHLASAQAHTIRALELALSECQKSRNSLQEFATNQQRLIQELEGAGA